MVPSCFLGSRLFPLSETISYFTVLRYCLERLRASIVLTSSIAARGGLLPLSQILAMMF